MKENYVKPEIVIRNANIKNYIICTTPVGDPPVEDPSFEPASIWSRQLTKDRNDIWDSGNDEASAW